MGKQVIAEARRLTIPEISHRLPRWDRPCELLAARVEVEPVLPSGFRPDLLFHTGSGRPLAVEVLVSHPCTPEKLEAYRAARLSALEVDLSPWRHGEVPDPFAPVVLRKAPRRWLWNAHVEADREAAERAERERQEAWKLESQQRIAAFNRSPIGRLFLKEQARRAAAQRARDMQNAAFNEEWRQIVEEARARNRRG